MLLKRTGGTTGTVGMGRTGGTIGTGWSGVWKRWGEGLEKALKGHREGMEMAS
jgi:hypothetical protein